MATIENNFDMFVKSIQSLKKSCQLDYECQLYTDNPLRCALLHEKYKTLCDVLAVASRFSENNVRFQDE